MKSTEIIDLYDETYFLGGKSKFNGQEIGVEGWQHFKQGKISPSKLAILSIVDVKGKNILDVGFGRGEIIKRSLECGAKSCVGIDYSPGAFKIASNYIKNPKAKLYCKSVTDVDKVEEKEFDVVYMVDILEHVSDEEWEEFFQKLTPKLSKSFKVIIQTPAFPMGEYLGMHNNYFTEQKLHGLLDKYFEISIHKGPKFLVICKEK
jgi:2-polyprenyl-3-methyl-5-hydroxy-6-metoxy-1,4-benzoquinol methylase